MKSKLAKLENHRSAPPLRTPTDLSAEAIQQVSAALNGLLADTFALYVKTKNFHWHVSGPFFRSYHLLLDDQAETLEDSIDILPAHEMLKELMSDNKAMIESMRAAHEVADSHDDVATASLLENFIDEAEKRCWFLFEATRGEGEKAKA